MHAGVHTTARGRRAFGSSARLAGLSAISPARIAAFSAARSVARIRLSVAGDTDDPSAWWWRVIAVSMACRWAAGSSAGRTRPRYGFRYTRTCPA